MDNNFLHMLYERNALRIGIAIFLLTIVVCPCHKTLVAEEILRPLNERFLPDAQGKIQTTEVPDFQRHISPLIGRLGCNGRACHGSFQGQGGFMLSLFGYDFDADHKALLDEKQPRVDLAHPLESLILNKPVSDDAHEGGKRFEKGGWEYQVLRTWIESGAPKRSNGAKSVQKLVQLDVSPAEILMTDAKQSQALRAIARWDNGTSEDVTTLCRFFSNDTSVAEVNEQGVVVGGDRGDTHVVVSYDNAVVPIPVLRPTGTPGSLSTQIADTKLELDRFVLTKLNKVGIQPSEICTDEEFIRRVSLDVAGTLPSSAQVKEFLQDRSADKRSQLIEELLASPGYAAWWTTFLCDITGNNDDQLNNASFVRNTASQHWYQWIFERVSENVPYDQIVEGIVTAVSRESGESYQEYCDAMTKIVNDKSGKSFADRSTMMYYWARNNQKTPEERAVGFAYSFCGVRIQCAQCHKHPFDQWSKQDFDLFERLFDGVQFNQNLVQADGRKDYDSILKNLGITGATKGNNLVKELQAKFPNGKYEKTIPFPEVIVGDRRAEAKKEKDKGKKGKTVEVASKPAKLLGGETVDLAALKDPRQPLMEWLRREDNPYFSKAIVNRIWSHYFSVGIVNPVDDLNLANAPSNAELLDYLAEGFVRSGYDLKWVHRQIVNSQTYQRSWNTNASNELDRRNFSHALLRRLPAETAHDAIRIAISNDKTVDSICSVETDRATTLAGASARSNNGNRGSLSMYALSVFGRSIRESNCDCDRSSDPSLLQTVFLRNDSDILRGMMDPAKGWLAQVAKEEGWSFQGASPALPNTPPKSMDTDSKMASMEDKDDKDLADLDRKVRSLRLRIDKLTAKGNPDSEIKKMKTSLTLFEKRLSEQKALVAKKQGDNDGVKSTETASVLNKREAADRIRLTHWIDEAYLRTLSRTPSAAERTTALASAEEAETPIHGLSDLLWALINSKEFILNH
jgi:hypothetical protein